MSGIESGNKNSAASETSADVVYLDQALWRRFSDASSPDAFAMSWLTLQVSMLKNITRGVVVLGPAERGPFAPAAVWPEGDAMPTTLSRTAESAMAGRKGVVHHFSQDDSKPSQLAYPLLVDDRLCGVVALEFSDSNETTLQMVMRQLQWGCGWFEAYLRRSQQDVPAASGERVSRLLELTATILENQRFRAAALAIVTELAVQVGCERVGLGLRAGRHTKIFALSHSSKVGEKTNLARAIVGAMDEAMDQLDTVVYPADDQRLATRAHAYLAEAGDAKAICTVVISSGDIVLGALTFERSNDEPFDGETIQYLDHAAALLGPVLEMKRRDDRLLITKAANSFRDLVVKLVGPKHYVAKLFGLLLAGLMLFLSLVEGDYRVTAEAVLEGAVQRTVVAPINGYIFEANARAGDVVQEGDVLFSIDDRDLRLEYLKWSSQKKQIDRRYRDALAVKNRSEVNIFKAQLEQAEAELEFLKQQIARTKVSAPFDGVVISGDLSQRLGAPVNRGDVLLNFAPLNEYRVALQVDERQISDIEPGQEGYLVLKALPDAQFPFVIETITPVSEASEGQNRFRVEAQVSEGIELLRPGMEGSAKVMIDRRKLSWIWTHDLVEWLRLWFWHWWP